MARATASVHITFGLVSIPVKIYVSASDESVQFNQITPQGNRVKQRLVDAGTEDEVQQADLVKGYEFARGQYVTFTQDEMAALQVPSSKTVEIREFVDAQTIDFLQVEKNYYLGPDKGGDKGYALLSEAMHLKGKVAVAQWATKGKEHLVVVRPYRGKLVLQVLFYSSEVRPFEDIEVMNLPVTDMERNMAAKLLDAMTSDEPDLTQYTDKFADGVRQAVDAKVAGRVVTITHEAPVKTSIDLMEALKQSLAEKPKAKGKRKGSRT